MLSGRADAFDAVRLTRRAAESDRELAADRCVAAIAHRLGAFEVIQLTDGTLYRVCAPEEAVAYFPRRAGVPPRPLRRVQLVDVPHQLCVYCLAHFPAPIELFHNSEACAASKPA